MIADLHIVLQRVLHLQIHKDKHKFCTQIGVSSGLRPAILCWVKLLSARCKGVLNCMMLRPSFFSSQEKRSFLCSACHLVTMRSESQRKAVRHPYYSQQDSLRVFPPSSPFSCLPDGNKEGPHLWVVENQARTQPPCFCATAFSPTCFQEICNQIDDSEHGRQAQCRFRNLKIRISEEGSKTQASGEHECFFSGFVSA